MGMGLKFLGICTIEVILKEAKLITKGIPKG
jgi:hypothetical protein